MGFGTLPSCGAHVGLFYPMIELGALALVICAAVVLSGIVLLCELCPRIGHPRPRTHRLANYLLPDRVIAFLLATGFAFSWLIDPTSLLNRTVGAVAGFAAFAAFARIYRRWRRARRARLRGRSSRKS